MKSNYVLTLGNLYNAKNNHHNAEGEKVDIVIKAVLREMYNCAE